MRTVASARRYVTVAEAAKRLELSEDEVLRMVYDGELAAEWFPLCLKVVASEVEELEEGLDVLGRIERVERCQ